MHVAELPHASVALHVLFFVYVFQQPGIVESTNAIMGLGSQPSVAVGLVKEGEEGQLIVAFAPCPLSVGGAISTTVIVWLTAGLTLPQASVALQVLFLA